MDSLRILTFVTICCSVVSSLRINDLIVPPQLQRGKPDNITLDCKYQIENENDRDGLVVKWFFKKTTLVYQWFPGRTPEVNSVWKENIDLNHRVSNDPLTKHRALRITNISTDMSGEYTCKVSSYESEASLTKMMVIYEPPKEFIFDVFENQSMLLCGAYHIFPKPIMEIYAVNVNLTNLDDDDNEENDNGDNLKRYLGSNYINDVEEAPGWYNVTKSFQYYPEEITEEVEFICELTIPNTSYSRKLYAVVSPEGETTSTTGLYDTDTTSTTTTIQSVVLSENSGVLRNIDVLILLASALVVIARYL